MTTEAKNKIVFVSPYATYPKQIFHDLEIENIFFIHQNLYLLIRGLFFITMLFLHTILLQNSILNIVLNI